MEEEKRTAAALTESPARALVATLLEVLKFTCLKLSCKDERERTRFVSIIIKEIENFSDRIRDNEKEVRVVTKYR